MEESNPSQLRESEEKQRVPCIWNVLFIIVLILGAYLRFVGLDWDGNHHLHPDERFLTMVETSLQPVKSLGEYFNTATSTLNPHNLGYSFYVYGTLPLFLVRYVAGAVGKIGYDDVQLVGRFLSGLFDLGTVLLVYYIVRRLYRKPAMAVLASAFTAFAVMEIQLSHFFTVDTFACFFTYLAFYFAIRIFTDRTLEKTVLAETSSQTVEEDGEIKKPEEKERDFRSLGKYWGSVTAYVLFGIAVGMAMASKVSIAPAALFLPIALLILFSRMEPESKRRLALVFLRNLAVAAVIAFITFRIFQPYAFKGPGIFGILPNDKWVNNLKELAVQSSGAVDFPPALQWARRPITFSWDNLVKWGMGLPLGLLAWAGFLWMGWRMVKGEWRDHLLFWLWTIAFFCWQGFGFVRSMRYQVLIYPSLAIIAAWAIVTLWDRREGMKSWFNRWGRRVLSVALGVGVVLATFGWAYAFTRIYTRPVTRVAASEWIYQNVPGAINLQMEGTDGKSFNEPLPFRSGMLLMPGRPAVFVFRPLYDGILGSVDFSNIVDSAQAPFEKSLKVRVAADEAGDNVLTSTILTDTFLPGDDSRGNSYSAVFSMPIPVEKGKTYYLVLEVDQQRELSIAGNIALAIQQSTRLDKQYLADPVDPLFPGETYNVQFRALRDGDIKSILINRMVDLQGSPDAKKMHLQIASLNDPGNSTSVDFSDTFLAANDPRGGSVTLTLNQPFKVTKDETYSLFLTFEEGDGQIALYGSRPATESTWDDSIPLGIEGYGSPFDYSSGLYRTDLNFEMYWDDNEDKRERFYRILDQVDYIFITSNRQWGTTTRVPERYPLTTVYYRNLMGCPADKDIFWCYSVAEPGMFAGNLGFDLVYINQSEPNLGSLTFNTQFAEEAFSVYDHPKVLIFKKRADYSPATVRQLLGAVDVSQAIHVLPGEVKKYSANLLLPEARLIQQQAGGTWSELFNRFAAINQHPLWGMVIWYLVITLLGWAVYPLVRIVFGGLADRGYPLSKLVGGVLLAYLTWLAGSVGIPFEWQTISLVALALLAGNAALFWLQRDSMRREWKTSWKYYLAVEGITLALFAAFLLVRLGNPDLWHPYKGGEKPMDFSYLNAVIKSTSFPPYDPWFAGGYINYYYYGFVLAGVLVKWLGMIPSIAYNLILPSFFSFVGIGAFCFGWNLLQLTRKEETGEEDEENTTQKNTVPWIAGLASTLGMLILGNLGTVRMIWHGLMKMVAPNGSFEGSNIIQRWAWTFQGLAKFIGGTPLPYGPGDWYWIPSRAIPGEPITEFPFFTFLYADPHAHLFALPVTVLALCWGLSVLMRCWKWSDEEGRHPILYFILSILVGGVVIGLLRPANTWDLPVYLVVGLVILLYTAFRYGQNSSLEFPTFPKSSLKWVIALGSAAILCVLAFVLYQPYTQWYAQGYNEIELWKGDHTPFWSYLTHWGLFLFVIVTWLFWETRDWMAKTPVSALNRLISYRVLITGLLVVLAVAVIGLLIVGVEIAWVALPLAVWAAVLILRPGQQDVKRLVLFMVGSGLVLTLVVELIVLKGDIGRMNTVFKFYMQAWTLLSLSAGAGLVWLFTSVPHRWMPRLRFTWELALTLLVAGAALFPIMGGMDKIKDRMNTEAPHTLDGMEYMASSTYNDNGVNLDLSQDYRAIQWMQDNVKGSPVIVEANTPEYQWGTRYTIYTGLPGVVGWNWHQRQQRGVVTPSEWVTNRVAEIEQFYRATDRSFTQEFLAKYNVKYIIVGQLERNHYAGPGIDKFAEWDGQLWNEVYRDDATAIYEVVGKS